MQSTILDVSELAQFSESVRGELSRRWGDATAAGVADAGSTRLLTLWSAATEAGWTALGEPGQLDAALALMDELGRVACPLPVIDVFAAARLFAEQADVVESIATADVRPLLIPDASSPVRFVDGAEGGSHAVVLPSGAGSVTLVPIVDRALQRGLAVPAWADIRVADEPDATVDATAAQVEEAKSLMRLGLLMRAIGAASVAHELALRHACDRVQFGRPIGSYQAVQHRAVEGLIDLTATRLLIAEAVRLWTADSAEWRVAVELAATFGAPAAKRVQFGAHHTLAAIGFFEEHAAPWLFRRVHSDITRLPLFAAATGLPERLLEEGAGLPSFDLGPAAATIREKVRQLMTGRQQATIKARRPDSETVQLLAEAGLVTMGWPTEFGGLDATPEEQAAVSEELQYMKAPIGQARGAANLIGMALIRHGTREQQERILPLIAEGKLPFYLGYSEPEVGSDLASLKTSATRDGDDWIINGRKMWGTNADIADYVWLATRTDPDAQPRHAGITVFLIPTGLEGWEIQKHVGLSGEISCSSFFDDVRVPDSFRVGEINGGWKVITDALAAERVEMAAVSSAMHRELDDLLDVLRTDRGRVIVGAPGSAKRALVAELAARVQAARALTNQSVRAVAGGGGRRLEAPMAKIITGELSEDFGEATLELLGPAAALSTDADDVPGNGAFEYSLRKSIKMVVGGGTGDIQRNQIARALGLPR